MKVLDASGVINIRGKELEGEFLTVPEIKAEIKDIQARMKFEAGIADGKIRLAEPSETALIAVREASKAEGVAPLLSEPDMRVLALAYERSLPIVTDDYDIQNMCLILKVKFEPIITRGVKVPFSWKKRCTACGKSYTTDISECEVCGSEKFSIYSARQPL
jgi:UPF0271 protein